MADFYAAKPGAITPIGLVGHRIAIWSAPNWNCFSIIFWEGFIRSRQLVFDLGAIASGARLANIALANLEMSITPPEMAQLRFYPLDDIEVMIKKGTADTKFKSKNIVTQSDIFTKAVDPCLHSTEFVVLKEDEPFAEAFNPTNFALAQSRIAFFGFRYILKDLEFSAPTVEEVEKKFTPITFLNAGGL